MGRAERSRVGRVRTAALAPMALSVVALLAACGSSSAPSASTTTTYHPLQPPVRSTATARTATASTAPTAPAAPAFPAVGTAQHAHAGATTLTVTVQRLIDPLAGSHAALLPHTRAVAVFAVIHNDGPGVYDSSSTGDFSIVPSTGAARPVFAPAGPCQTPLRDWDNEISPGEARSGCVAFALGAHAKVTEVRFSPHAHAAGRASWSVGR